VRSGRRARDYYVRVHSAPEKVATSAPGELSIADPWYRMILVLAAQRPRWTPSFRPLHATSHVRDGGLRSLPLRADPLAPLVGGHFDPVPADRSSQESS
jgi:hypothetical protein